ncbi:putative lipoprotein [Bacteriovorax sp. BSW11_IV]|nr:putative lipoprotein [Bacteriovorax sp. BSW11_IV]
MNIKILISLFMLGFLSSCGSNEFIPTTDICSVEKHYRDDIYQVKIEGKKINNHWYLKDDALEVTKFLANKNKCMH